MAQDDAIVRLARQIDAARKAERFLVNADEVASLRRHGACELHRIWTNTLAEGTLDLSPATYAPEMFREPGVNLIQISSEGRQLLSQELHHYHRVIQRHSRATSTVSVIGPPRVPTRVPAKYDQHCDRPGVQSYEYLGRTIRQ